MCKKIRRLLFYTASRGSLAIASLNCSTVSSSHRLSPLSFIADRSTNNPTIFSCYHKANLLSSSLPVNVFSFRSKCSQLYDCRKSWFGSFQQYAWNKPVPDIIWFFLLSPLAFLKSSHLLCEQNISRKMFHISAFHRWSAGTMLTLCFPEHFRYRTPLQT